jgi:transposase
VFVPHSGRSNSFRDADLLGRHRRHQAFRWDDYCTLNEDGEVVDRGRFRTNPSSVDKWFTDLPRVRIGMEAGTHSIWISEQLQLGHEVIVANVRELRAISHSDRKSDQVDAEKLARFARLDPKIPRPIAHRTVAQQEALTLIRARNLIVRLRTAAVNAVRGLAKPCGYRLPASSTLCFAERCGAMLPPGLARALGPVLHQIEVADVIRPQAAGSGNITRLPGRSARCSMLSQAGARLRSADSAISAPTAAIRPSPTTLVVTGTVPSARPTLATSGSPSGWFLKLGIYE